MTDEIKVLVSSHGAGRNLVMYYIDPVTELRVARSAGTRKRTEANRNAAVWQDELNSGRYVSPNRIAWQEFRTRYEEEKLATLAQGTQDAAASALNHLKRVLNPKRLSSLTSDVMSRLQAELRKEGMRETTLACHLRHIGAALGWAVSIGMLAKAPRIQRSKRLKGQKFMKGRPITAEEFDRMLDKIPATRPEDAAVWARYLTGLWLSGLRLVESLTLSWEPDAPFAVDLSGKYPRFRICAEAEKGNQDRLLPMTPDFARWLLQTPEADRDGRVFTVNGLGTGRPLTDKRVTRIITRIGKAAGVVVDRRTKKFRETENGKTRLVEREVVKYASAHDLRRAFATRWARKVRPTTLQKLMRHAFLETTMRYYVEIDADEIAAELWQQETDQGRPHTLPHTGPDSPQNVTRGPVDGSTEAPCREQG